jgi:hypothetical protein
MALGAPSHLAASAHTYTFAVPAITTASLAGATVGVPYSANIVATGGLQPYTWHINDGLLPPGLTLNSQNASTAKIAGTPTSSGNFKFTIICTDAGGQTASITALMSH